MSITLDQAAAELASYERRGFIDPALKQHLAETAARLRGDLAAAADPRRN